MLPLERKPLLSYRPLLSTLNVASTDGHYSSAKSLQNALDLTETIITVTGGGLKALSGPLYVGLVTRAKVLNNIFQ